MHREHLCTAIRHFDWPSALDLSHLESVGTYNDTLSARPTMLNRWLSGMFPITPSLTGSRTADQTAQGRPMLVSLLFQSLLESHKSARQLHCRKLTLSSLRESVQKSKSYREQSPSQ